MLILLATRTGLFTFTRSLQLIPGDKTR